MAIVLLSCKVRRDQKANFNMLYDPAEPYHLFGVSLFHADKMNSEVHLNIPQHWFLKYDETLKTYNSPGFLMRYEFFSNENAKFPADTGSVFLNPVVPDPSFWFTAAVSLPLGEYSEGKLSVHLLKDGKKKVNYSLPFNRKDPGNRQYFYVRQQDSEKISQTILTVLDTFQLCKSPLVMADSLYVFYFRHFADIAAPPFSVEAARIFPWKKDSVFIVAFENHKTTMLNFSKPGVYHFMSDTSARHGFTVFIAGPDYPFITGHNQMSGPVRYICSNKEFQRLIENPDTRAAVENFWLSVSPNPEAAKRRIKDYYNRVQNANMFFTSYKEGWMTDRGMIYIVMGRPGVVHKSLYQEIWIYGQEKNLQSTTFEFRKVLNPLSDNDYILLRYPVFRDKWYRAVDMWRK